MHPQHRPTLLLLGLAAVAIGALLVAGCTGSTGGPATPTPTLAPKTVPTTAIATPATTGAPALADTTAPATPGATTPSQGAYTPSGASGKISVTGSTTVLPIAQALAERYMVLNPNADVQVSGGGSGVGVQAAGEKTAEIGMSSRDLKDAEKTKYPGLKPVAMARDGIVMIVHPSNTIPHLTLAQIKDIYSGKAANWRDIGGLGQPVVVIGRDAASGTREFFNEKVMGNTSTTKSMLEKNSNGAIQSSVAPNPGAIGYVGMGYIDQTVRAVNLSVNGTDVAPTVENVVSGAYPLSRNLYYVTNGEATGLAADFIAFTLSPEGQQIVVREGFVSIER